MPNLRSQGRNSTTNDRSSTDDIPTNVAAEHTRNTTSGCKRKNKNNESVPITNDVQIQRQQHDRSPHKRQHTEDDCESEESTKTNDDHTPLEESLATIILDLDYYKLCKLAKEKLSWKVGNGQRHVLSVQRELIKYYNDEGIEVDNLKADIAAINYYDGFSSDSNSDDSDDEVEEISKKSTAVAATEDAAEEDKKDFSFDNNDGNESIDGTTDGLGQLDTAPANIQSHDNATQSSTTTATLKLAYSCVEKGLDENREDVDPSPTFVNTDLSRLTNDISPAPDTDSNNGSIEDAGEHDVLNFDIRPKCIEGSDGVVSPKKVTATKSVSNAPAINPSTQLNYNASVLPPQNQYYPPQQYQYGYNYSPQNYYGYPPNQYSYPPHYGYPPNQYYPPLPNQYGYGYPQPPYSHPHHLLQVNPPVPVITHPPTQSAVNQSNSSNKPKKKAESQHNPSHTTVPCTKMPFPIPSRCPLGTTATDAELPDFSHLVNFPLARQLNKCTMCNTSEFNIPKQNKGICKGCDSAIWIVNSSGMYIKWCKGCKNFHKLVDFGDKSGATKCERCREKAMKRYHSSASKLEAPEKSKKEKKIEAKKKREEEEKKISERKELPVIEDSRLLELAAKVQNSWDSTPGSSQSSDCIKYVLDCLDNGWSENQLTHHLHTKNVDRIKRIENVVKKRVNQPLLSVVGNTLPTYKHVVYPELQQTDRNTIHQELVTKLNLNDQGMPIGFTISPGNRIDIYKQNIVHGLPLSMIESNLVDGTLYIDDIKPFVKQHQVEMTLDDKQLTELVNTATNSEDFNTTMQTRLNEISTHEDEIFWYRGINYNTKVKSPAALMNKIKELRHQLHRMLDATKIGESGEDLILYLEKMYKLLVYLAGATLISSGVLIPFAYCTSFDLEQSRHLVNLAKRIGGENYGDIDTKEEVNDACARVGGVHFHTTVSQAGRELTNPSQKTITGSLYAWRIALEMKDLEALKQIWQSLNGDDVLEREYLEWLLAWKVGCSENNVMRRIRSALWAWAIGRVKYIALDNVPNVYNAEHELQRMFDKKGLRRGGERFKLESLLSDEEDSSEILQLRGEWGGSEPDNTNFHSSDCLERDLNIRNYSERQVKRFLALGLVKVNELVDLRMAATVSFAWLNQGH